MAYYKHAASLSCTASGGLPPKIRAHIGTREHKLPINALEQATRRTEARAITDRSALEMTLANRIYLHEYIDIIGASRAAYFDHMTAAWRAAAIERRQRTFGIWGTLGSTGRWPEAVNLWEYDSWEHLADTFAHETGSPGMQDPILAEW